MRNCMIRYTRHHLCVLHVRQEQLNPMENVKFVLRANFPRRFPHRSVKDTHVKIVRLANTHRSTAHLNVKRVQRITNFQMTKRLALCKSSKADHDSDATTPCEIVRPTHTHGRWSVPNCRPANTAKTAKIIDALSTKSMMAPRAPTNAHTETETRTKFDQLIKDLPYGEEAVNQKHVQQFANMIDCSSIQSFKKRLVGRDQNGNIAFLPGLLVTPWDGTNEQNCKTPTRQWEKGQCVIDYETELLDYLHYQHVFVEIFYRIFAKGSQRNAKASLPIVMQPELRIVSAAMRYAMLPLEKVAVRMNALPSQICSSLIVHVHQIITKT